MKKLHTMTKIQIKKLLAVPLSQLRIANNEIAINRWVRAKALSKIHDMINWVVSPYGSFQRFLDQEVKGVSYGSQVIWRKDYKTAMALNYSWKEIEAISKEVSYSRTCISMASLERKIPIKRFILRANKLKNSSIARGTTNCDNRTFISLSDKRMAKFEALLRPYGFHRTSKGTRVNFSSALGEYVDAVS